MKFSITCLDSLIEAGDDIGLEFVRDQTRFRAYYNNGRSTHAFRVRHGKANTYEVGVKLNEDGTYSLLFDSFAGGHGLMAVIGAGADSLKQAYTAARSARQLKREGYTVTKRRQANGHVLVRAFAR